MKEVKISIDKYYKLQNKNNVIIKYSSSNT